MKKGDKVITVADFTGLALEWGMPYPEPGDLLTIMDLIPHPSLDCRSKGIVLLYFRELPNSVGLSSSTIKGSPNFIVVPPLHTMLEKKIQKLEFIELKDKE